MPPDSIAPGDLEICRALLAAGSKSFALAACGLPPRVRASATVLYAFCRLADDAIDADPGANAATVGRLRQRLDGVYAASAGGALADPVDRALAVVVARERIPRAVFEALLEGMAWDAEGRRYETLDDVQGYAARVAGTVGVMMTLVMGRRDAATLARACELGVAMQLTNIARDVGEDARRGRIYLPLSWLRAAGLDPDDLVRRPRPSRALGQVVRRLLEEAERLYTSADAGLLHLPADCRAAIRAARLCYAEIGRQVAAAGYDSVTRRAVVPAWRKLRLLLQAAASVPAPQDMEMGTLAAPPLEAARFLFTPFSTGTAS
jgi:phytoene synthase